MVGIAGSLSGIVAGYFLAGWITHFYAATMGIPQVFTTMDWRAAALAVAAAMAVCIAASLLPVWRLVKLYPARVMRVDGDGGVKRAKRREGKAAAASASERRIPVNWSIPFHNITRDARRSFFNLLGVVFSIMLILVSLSMLDWLNSILDFQYNRVIRYDADVSFASPEGAEKIDALSRLPGVSRVEPYAMIPCRFEAGGEVIGEGIIKVVPPDCELLGFYNLQGRQISMPEDGVFFSNWFHNGLKVKDGDEIVADTPVGRVQLGADDFVRQLGGLTAFVNRDMLKGTPAEGECTPGPWSPPAKGDMEALRAELEQVGGVAGVAIPDYVMEMMRTSFLGMIFLFVGFLIAFAVAMALALIYNTMTIAFLEREREVTLMLALGYDVRRVAALFAVENLMIALAAIVPGLIMGHYAFMYMMKTMTNEFIDLPGVTSLRSYLIAAVCLIPVVLLAQLPSLRRVRRVDLTRAIKDRSL